MMYLYGKQIGGREDREEKQIEVGKNGGEKRREERKQEAIY